MGRTTGTRCRSKFVRGEPQRTDLEAAGIVATAWRIAVIFHAITGIVCELPQSSRARRNRGANVAIRILAGSPRGEHKRDATRRPSPRRPRMRPITPYQPKHEHQDIPNRAHRSRLCFGAALCRSRRSQRRRCNGRCLREGRQCAPPSCSVFRGDAKAGACAAIGTEDAEAAQISSTAVTRQRAAVRCMAAPRASRP